MDFTIVFVDTISNVSCSEHLTRRFGDMIRYLPSGSIRQIQTFAQLLSFVGVQRNMEEYGLESFEDPSDIIEDVVEISVENSVEANLLCKKSECIHDRSG